MLASRAAALQEVGGSAAVYVGIGQVSEGVMALDRLLDHTTDSFDNRQVAARSNATDVAEQACEWQGGRAPWCEHRALGLERRGVLSDRWDTSLRAVLGDDDTY